MLVRESFICLQNLTFQYLISLDALADTQLNLCCFINLIFIHHSFHFLKSLFPIWRPVVL